MAFNMSPLYRFIDFAEFLAVVLVLSLPLLDLARLGAVEDRLALAALEVVRGHAVAHGARKHGGGGHPQAGCGQAVDPLN